MAALPTYLPQLGTSLRIMSITLVLTIVFGLPLAWLFARQKVPGGRLIEWFASLPLSVPGIAIGLALIATYPGLQSFGVMVVAGHVLITMPFMIAALIPVLVDEEQRDLEMVAMTLGASPTRRFMTLTLPHLRTALLSGALMVSAISLGEFNITYFVISPANPTLPVGLFSAFIYGSVSDAASQTILFILAVLPISILIQWIGKLLVKGSGE
jgi:putative spermidine/putrescine transport system permease protein